MSTMEKYQIVESESSVYLETEINRLVDGGYKLHTFKAIEIEGEHIRKPQYIAVMELAAKDTYEGIEHLKDVPPPEVDAHLADGWKIASSSISTKFVRMVKTK